MEKGFTTNDISKFKFNELAEDTQEDFGDKRILVVDDQSYNIDAIMIILSTSFKLDADKMCSKAFNGNQALAKVKSNVEFFKGE